MITKFKLFENKDNILYVSDTSNVYFILIPYSKDSYFRINYHPEDYAYYDKIKYGLTERYKQLTLKDFENEFDIYDLYSLLREHMIKISTLLIIENYQYIIDFLLNSEKLQKQIKIHNFNI